ncbi:lactadherin-like isoform X2 [Dreissena polymorpha]|uniref:lactadherin-like isoform X2 n=1 Tax=Dreissena polymorpha TaxID=45954 RepID=UPI002264B0C5|nr:lactadherin-like isoform X2 [Dreissena polymorpha]
MKYIKIIFIYAIYLAVKFTPGYTYIACSGSLGVNNPLSVTDAQLSSSSARDEFTGAERGRLNLSANGSYAGGWAAGNGDSEHYIQVNLLAPYDVTGVVTQGRADRQEWTATFEILYSTDGIHFLPVPDTARGGGARRFDGNADQDTLVTNLFPSVTAKWIRIHPVAWMGSIALRFDVLGCHANTVFTQVQTTSSFSQPTSANHQTTMDKPTLNTKYPTDNLSTTATINPTDNLSTTATIYSTDDQSTTANIYIIEDHSTTSSIFPYISRAAFEARDPLTTTWQPSQRGTALLPSQTSIDTWALAKLQFALATSGVSVLGLILLIMTIAFCKQYRKTKVSAQRERAVKHRNHMSF